MQTFLLSGVTSKFHTVEFSTETSSFSSVPSSFFKFRLSQNWLQSFVSHPYDEPKIETGSNLEINRRPLMLGVYELGSTSRISKYRSNLKICKGPKVEQLKSQFLNFHFPFKNQNASCGVSMDLARPNKSKTIEKISVSWTVQKPRTDVRIDDGEERGVCAVCSSSYVVDLRTNACVYMCECGKSGLAASGGGGKYPRRFT